METRQLFSVLVVFALLALALWVLRRRGALQSRVSLPSSGFSLFKRTAFRNRDSREKSLAVIERLALTPQHSLHLVKIDGRVVVVATHPQGCAIVCEQGSEDDAKGHCA